jgi:three-Cys-motif partner protein
MLELSPHYEGREQSYLKHYVLSNYLELFGRIIASRWRTINYIDSFAGPWEHSHSEYLDTSFVIATERLREAQAWAQDKFHRDLRVRCRFLEKDKPAFKRLDAYAKSLTDIEAKALNSEFEAAVPELLRFAREMQDAFTFSFIDPTGWTGFAMNVIEPLLQISPGEVLINFMTAHIRRFLEDEKSTASFVKLFGRDVRKELEGLSGDAREERAVGEYMRSVKRAGKFRYVGSAIVFKPEVETPHFHLMYATRDNKGVKVFKEVEEKLFAVTQEVRADAKERRRARDTGMNSMFPPAAMHRSSGVDERRRRYLHEAKSRVQRKLEKGRNVPYEVVWRMALGYPLVWERDLREWVEDWKSAGKLVIPTHTGRQRAPMIERDELEWIK